MRDSGGKGDEEEKNSAESWLGTNEGISKCVELLVQTGNQKLHFPPSVIFSSPQQPKLGRAVGIYLLYSFYFIIIFTSIPFSFRPLEYFLIKTLILQLLLQQNCLWAKLYSICLLTQSFVELACFDLFPLIYKNHAHIL